MIFPHPLSTPDIPLETTGALIAGVLALSLLWAVYPEFARFWREWRGR